MFAKAFSIAANSTADQWDTTSCGSDKRRHLRSEHDSELFVRHRELGSIVVRVCRASSARLVSRVRLLRAVLRSRLL